jgi:hypothetical protein
MEKTNNINNSRWLPTFYFLLGFSFIQLLDYLSIELISFITKNIFLIIFLGYNIISYKKNNPERWLLNPIVLASIFTFLLGYCVTNYVYFIPNSENEKLMNRLLPSDNLFFFNKGMNAIIIAAIAMWIGYKSKLGVRLYNFILRFPINYRKYFRSSSIPKLPAIYIITVLAIATRLYTIDLGIYGYASSPDRLSASIGIVYILVSVGDVLTFCLLVVSFAYFKNVKNFKLRVTFYLLLIIQIIFGILSGMKGTIVMPFVLAFITYYLVNNKLNKSLIIAVAIFIIIAYQIVEPFRMIISREAAFKSSPTNIANTMVDAYELNQSRKVVTETENIFESIISRNAFLLGAAKSIQYSDVHGLGQLDPDFLEKIYTIPLQTFIPRLFWSDKPVEDFSRWFSFRVWGGTATTSVAMTPFGFLYFAGGMIFIFLGFLIIGIMQKTLWQFYLAGGGQILIFLAFLSTVVLIDSAYNGMVVYWLRYFPVFIFLQTLLFKKTSSHIGQKSQLVEITKV